MIKDENFIDKKIINFIMKSNDDDLEKLDKYNEDINLGYAFINDMQVLFERRNILKNKVSMLLPLNFKQIEDEDFPMKELVTNDDDTVQIFLVPMFSDAGRELVEPTRNEIMKNLEKEYGNVLTIGEFETCEGEKISYFEQDIEMEGEDVNTTIFFFCVDGYMIMGSINLVKHRVCDWKHITIQIVKSIQILK